MLALASVQPGRVTGQRTRTVLRHAHVVQHDAVVAGPVSFADGRVCDASPDAVPIDLPDHLIFPGLINAHDHLQLNAIPPLPQSEPFPNSYAWISAFESHLTSAAVVTAVAVPSDVRHWHGGLKNLLAGVTTVAHHDPWHHVFDRDAFPVGVLRHFGWSHSLELGESRDGAVARYGPPVVESFNATPPHQPWIIHLAEGTDAVAMAELARLDDLGCLAANTVLVHGTGLTRTDVARIIERGASVVWCPSSNLGMLGLTLAPRTLFQAGRLTLGSDSRLTGSADLLEELAVASRRSDLSPNELLRLVTADARRVLRVPTVGDLAFGHNADCVIVRNEGDAYGSLVGKSRRAIRAVVRGGVPVVADPDFAEWFALCGVETVEVTLDGVPKLLARNVAWPEAVALEPGLEFRDPVQ